MKLLIVTQVQDPAHPAMGFFVEWIEAFRRHPSVEAVNVITTNGSGSRIGRIVPAAVCRPPAPLSARSST